MRGYLFRYCLAGVLCALVAVPPASAQDSRQDVIAKERAEKARALSGARLRRLRHEGRARIVSVDRRGPYTGDRARPRRRPELSALDEARYHNYSDRNDTFSFDRLDGEIVQHFLILRENWVISLHGLVETTLGNGDDVPYFLMPSLGSGSTLRGFTSWRFRDRHRLLMQAEFRWIPNRTGLDMPIFYDTGKVASRGVPACGRERPDCRQEVLQRRSADPGARNPGCLRREAVGHRSGVGPCVQPVRQAGRSNTERPGKEHQHDRRGGS